MVPDMFYLKFHSPRPIFYSPNSKFTHIGKQESVSFRCCMYWWKQQYLANLDWKCNLKVCRLCILNLFFLFIVLLFKYCCIFSCDCNGCFCFWTVVFSFCYIKYADGFQFGGMLSLCSWLCVIFRARHIKNIFVQHFSQPIKLIA